MKLKYARALEVLVECIAERGSGYVYRRPEGDPFCVNWHEDTGCPGCIIGLAVSKLAGADVVRENPSSGASGLLFAAKISATQKALTLFRETQIAQDHGKSWGEAVMAGIAHAANCDE